MEKIIAYCGIVCSECPAYIATQNNDDAKRRETAEQWTKQFGHEMKPEDINCDGCLTDTGRIVSYCAICEIRKCARERGMVNCAYCDDYACDKLEKFFEMAPMFRATLDEIRKGL
jgi:predicted nucleic acid binding AN1-type Zn finger protein